MPSVGRNHAAFLCCLRETSILIDCGESIDSSYKASGLNYDAIDAIFLSHLHADHFGGLFMLLQGFWLEGRRKPLPLYVPEYALASLRQMLQAAMLLDELLQFRLQLLPIPESASITVGRARITAFPTSHLQDVNTRFSKKYGHNFIAYSFLIEADGRHIAHSADLGKPEDLDPLLKQPLDLLICELAHFKPEQLFQYLKGRPIKQAAFVHLARYVRERFGEVQEMAAKMLPGLPYCFPNDSEEIRL
jgi:ribonuclease Z